MLIKSALLVLFVLCVLFFLGRFLASPYRKVGGFNTAYECGFDSFGSARVPFSLSFFLLSLLFMVFDLEVVILFPVCASLFEQMPLLMGVVTCFVFLLILYFGLLYEY
jgi:NADH:ubiquinone oxidoreductase subunit 3 (subunit A)